MIVARWRGVLVGLLILGALGVYVARHMRVVTDITYFLPGGEDSEVLDLSRELVTSELSRTMVLTVGAPTPRLALDGGRALEAALRADPELQDAFVFIRGGPESGTDKAMWRLYQPRRLGFLADSPAAARAKLTPAALRAAAVELKRRLGLPIAPLVAKLAPSDPLLTLPRLFETLAPAHGGGLQVVDGRFMSADHHAVLLLATRASAFDGARQAPLIAALEAAFRRVNRDGTLQLQYTGVNRFAVRAEASIKADISRISVLSVLGLVLLFGVLFRSLRLVALTSLPVGAGMLTACAVVLAVFGRIHGLTLAFGASLIGVCIDYTIHLYCHHTLGQPSKNTAPIDARATLRRIWPGLLLGALTTVAGFAVLGASAFPGLREVAVFASVGIMAALAATRFMLPALLPPRPRRTRALTALARGMTHLLIGMRRLGPRLWALPLLGVVVAAVGIPTIQWDDDVSHMNRLDPALMAEDQAVRARVAQFEQRRFVVALGETRQEALAVNDRIARQLQAAVEAGELRGFRSLGTLLPSAAQQEAVADAVRQEPGLRARFERAFEAEGFRTALFQPFFDSLNAAPPTPLTYEDLAQSPLAFMVRAFEVRLSGRVGILSYLEDVRAPDALAARVEGIPDAVFLDQVALMSGAYRAYRRRTLQLLIVGLLVVLGLVGARYRRLRPTLAAFLPALLSGAVTVAVLGLLGLPVNLVALTALLMVLSMGVDYGVFLAESHTHHPEELPATLASVLLACLSTVFGFGLLGLSIHPPLMIIGITAGVGVLVSLLLAPATLVLLERPEGT